MLSPAFVLRAARRIQSRKLKALGFEVLRRLGMRYMVVRLDTINLCNLRCRMCYYSLEVKRKKEEMDLSLFRKIADNFFPKTRFLYLSCQTEPLVNKNFAEFVRVAGQYGVPFTSFCTNGQLLNEDVIQACIESRTSEIIFSVDGATAETYEYIRRGGRWDRLVANIDLLASMKRQAQATLPAARINFTSMLRNIEELPAMVRFAAEHGISAVHVRHLLPFFDEENSCEQEMGYKSIFNSVALQAEKEAKALGVDLFLPELVQEKPACAVGRAGGARTENNPHCALPWYHTAITWTGECAVCPAHTRMGNIRQAGFAAIQNGPAMQEIRRRMFWRTPDACSWDCIYNAHTAQETPAEEPTAPDGSPAT